MFSNTASGAPALTALQSQSFASFLRWFAGLFSITTTLDRTRASHLWWLAGLMLLGAAVRLWGLGNVGFHGDEETMAMAVSHILIDGRPTLPSGMFYPRGMTQLYLMAASSWAFGESEWALRLPSVLCGVALIPLAYVVSRRFLRPHWSVALAASVAFLPDLIVDSQTARMYIFLVASVMASLACVFVWERGGSVYWLIGAAAALIVGLDFQVLAASAMLVLMLPGLLHADARKFLHGCAAMIVVTLAFLTINYLTNAQYPVPPPEFAADLGPPPWELSRAPTGFLLQFDIVLWAVGVAGVLFALRVAQVVQLRGAAIASAALLIIGMGFQLALFYHIAALAYVAATALAFRHGTAGVSRRLLPLASAAAVLTLMHVYLLADAQRSLVQVIGAMVGQPSPWPYVRAAQLSPVAGGLTALLLCSGLYRYARREPLPDYWLLAAMGVWAPLFALGLFAWNVAPRYTEMCLPVMLICAFAFAQQVVDALRGATARMGVLRTSLAALTAVCIVNPSQAAATINAGYRIHPDHKGAAEFIRSQQITEDDILMAEDVLQQTYYLGKVDYWLIGKQVARKFVVAERSGVVDFYTGTPVISTGAMLDEVLRSNPGRRIFVIGSGEDQSDGRRVVRGDELHAALQSERFATLYVGRDGLTRVLRAIPNARTGSHAASIDSYEEGTHVAQDAATAAAAKRAAPVPVRE